MAQAEGTSKNEGRVSPSDSDASKGRSSGYGSSSRTEKDDGRPTSRGISESKSRDSGFGSSGSGGGRSGAANSNPSSKTGGSKSSGYSSFGQSTPGSIGKALGSLLGGGVGGFVGGSIGKSLDHMLGGDRMKGPQGAIDAVTGKTVAESQNKSAKGSNTTRDFSGLGKGYADMANTLAAAGWTNSMIAGYLGSTQQESGGNPRARNKGDAQDGTDSVGQGQWNMDRLTNLESYAKGLGTPWDDNVTQTKFTLHELTTTHKHVADKLAKAEDNPEAYASVFGKNYEVSKQIPERQAYARQWANKISELGIPDVEKAFTKVDDFVSSIQNIDKPVGQKPTTQNTDPFGIGTLLSSTLGISNPNTGKQKDGTYVDPYVSSVAGRAARGESDAPSPTKGRTGVGGIIEKGQKNQPLGVVAGVVKAASDPIGFAVDTIMDIGNQSKAMNTPGPEGEGGDLSQQEFGLGFLSSFLSGGHGSSGGFAPSEKNGGGSSQVIPTPTVDAPTITPTAPVTPVTPVPVANVRKPFQWSTITGTLDNLLGTTYNG